MLEDAERLGLTPADGIAYWEAAFITPQLGWSCNHIIGEKVNGIMYPRDMLYVDYVKKRKVCRECRCEFPLWFREPQTKN